MEFKIGDKVRVKPGFNATNKPPSSRGHWGVYPGFGDEYHGRIFLIKAIGDYRIYLEEPRGYYWFDTWLEKVPTRKVNLRPRV